MNKNAKFLNILYELINNQQNQKIVKFCSDGQGFVILDWNKFRELVKSSEFGIESYNYSTFQRNLNLYGFKMRRNAENQKEFKHPQFGFDQTKLSKVSRKIKKNNKDNLDFDTNSIRIISRNNSILYKQLTILKKQQEHIVHQLQITYKLQILIQKIINNMINRHFKKYCSNESKQCEQVFVNLMTVLSGNAVSAFSEICKFILEKSYPEIQELMEFNQNMSPLPFYINPNEGQCQNN